MSEPVYFDFTNPNTGEVLSGQSADIYHLLWQEGCDRHEENADFFNQFEGSGSESPIVVKNDLAKGAGQSIIFTQISGFYKEPKRGSENFTRSTDFERIKLNTQRLVVDWFRHACRWDERAEEFIGMRGEIIAGVPEAMGDWLGRYKSEQAAMTFREKGQARNYCLPPDCNSIDDLTYDNTLDYEFVINATTKLKTMNGRPAQIGTQGRNKIKKYIIVPLTETLMSLEMDPTYQSQLENADVRGDANFLFQGGFHNLRGHALVEWNNVDHDGDGAVGTPFNPKARLGVAITADNEVQNIWGGGDSDAAVEDNTYYFKWFPGFQYKWIVGDTKTSQACAAEFPYYVFVHNDGVESSPGAGDQNKWGFYEISANDGVKLTVAKRLRAVGDVTGNNIAYTHVGGVYWDANVNTDAHPENAFVVYCNKYAVPVFKTLIMGAAAARRGYGKHRNTRGDDGHEANFIQEIFVKSVFGQHLRQDRKGRYPGFLMLTHAGMYPNIKTSNAKTAA